MNANHKLFPLIVTRNLDKTREYYVKRLGCEPVHDMSDYLQVRFGGEEGPELSFMTEGAAPSLADNGNGGKLAPFNGEGLIISIPADKADERCEELRGRGVSIRQDPTDRPWGWRSFVAVDPNGVALDFFEVPGQSATNHAAG